MERCKDCMHFVSSAENPKLGSCTVMGDELLMSEYKTIIDYSEDDRYPYSVEVGENFGCIHYEFNILRELKDNK